MTCPRRQCFFFICYTWRTILGTCHHNSYKRSRNEVSMFLIRWTPGKISFTIRLFFSLSEQTCTAIEGDGILNVCFFEFPNVCCNFYLCILNMIQSLPRQHNPTATFLCTLKYECRVLENVWMAIFSESNKLWQIKCPSNSGQMNCTCYFLSSCDPYPKHNVFL
jgi:hypothetical protein